MSDPNDDDLRPEYDLGKLAGGVRGKHYRQYQEGSNIVVLEPDVAEAFPDARSVNEALRKLMAEANRGAT